MELLVWHDALGCDDEQAEDHELLARVLYAHSTSSSSSSSSGGESDASASACLQTLHFVQGLLAFVRVLKRPSDPSDEDTTTAAPADDDKTDGASKHERRRLEWISVTLSKRRFFVQEVEPQIFMALGIHSASDIKEHRFVYKALMRDLYGLFCLFHGRIDSNLRQLPAADEATKHNFADGMELLLAIKATRKRLRKLRIAIEACLQQHQSDEDQSGEDQYQVQGSTLRRLQEDTTQSQAELNSLLALSPAAHLAKRFDALFPTLLHALDAPHASSLHELTGMGQLPVDASTFLSLQSFLNAFSLEMGDKVGASAIFCKGNLLWSSMDASTLQLLYRFLRLREENGMEMESVSSNDNNNTSNRGDIWMKQRYRDTFLPVWSSKTSYAECTIVNHARRHPRKSVRSLHRQSPSPLATVVTDANGTPHTTSSNANKLTFAVAVSENDVANVRALSKSALKARIRSVAYRNTGLLMKNGYFAKTFELPIKSRGRGKFSESEAMDFIWKPRVFTSAAASGSGENGSSNAQDKEEEHGQYAVLWHESDLSMLLLMKPGGKDTEDAGRILDMLGSIEDAMDRLKFHELAKLILSQSAAQSGGTGSSAYPFVYLNRANGTFKAHGVPRLLKRKDGSDVLPSPLRLLANYLPQQTLSLLDHLHSELQKCDEGETRDACVKTLHDGWVLGKKSHTTQREFYAFFDTKVPSVADLSDSLEDLLQEQFGNVFL